jgi:hypothetical protein
MQWQDQAPARATPRVAPRGAWSTPQYFFERAAIRLEDELPVIMNAEIDKALAKAGLV